MAYTYEEIIIDNFGNEITVIKRSDGAWIPKDKGNLDYQLYLNPDLENGTIS